MPVPPKNHFTNHPYAAHDDNVAVKDSETKGETLMKRILLVVCLSLLSASAAWAILNGTIDTNALYRGVGQIPATAGHPLCTATLISRNAILTTASCLTDSTANAVFMFSPRVGQAANVNAIYVNPNFPGPAGGFPFEVYDIAVAVLDKSKDRGWSYRPYALNTAPLTAGTIGSAVGFGATGVGGTGAGPRNFGSLRFDGYLADYDAFGTFIPNAYEQIDPATSTYQMICPGDTGGPFLVNGAIAGLAAFTQHAPCSQGGSGSGFEMTVDRLAPWITATLNQYDPPGACDYNDDTAFVTAQGGCEDLATKLVWGKLDARATQAGAAAECGVVVIVARARRVVLIERGGDPRSEAVHGHFKA